MQTLIDLLEFLRPYGSHSYAVMFGILILCGFGLPLPEDIVLITGGILASHGVANFEVVVLVTLAGVLIGDGIVFSIGAYFGPSLRNHAFVRRILTEKRDRQVQAIFHKYGEKVIFMARFMPGLRTPVFLTCGSYHVRPWKFVMFDGFAALISVPLWVYVGLVFGQNLEELEHRIHQFKVGFYAALAGAIVLFVAFTLVKKRAMRRIEAEEESRAPAPPNGPPR